MEVIEFDMIQTAGVGAVALVLGMFLTRHISFLRRFCVPSPVTGGLVFSLATLSLYKLCNVEVSFDGTLKDVCMLAFFTSVGFQSNLKVLKQGGRLLLLMLAFLLIIIILQNVMPIAITKMLGVDPLIGMAAGSISMTGGHGTAGGFAMVLEDMGLKGAGTIAMAAATFGLVAGSMIGGPIAERLINKKVEGVDKQNANDDSHKSISDVQLQMNTQRNMGKDVPEYQRYANAAYCILIVMAGGTVFSWLLQSTGITFPTYFGALILAAIVRNVMSMNPRSDKLLDMERIVSVGNICLSLFLGMAMISLKLWELQSLALPLITILLCQAIMLALLVYFVAFRLLGKDYDAAVLVAGICGFALGATPNAMANMSAVCEKYHFTVKPFLIVPIIGAMFADLINTSLITIFLSVLR